MDEQDGRVRVHPKELAKTLVCAEVRETVLLQDLIRECVYTCTCVFVTSDLVNLGAEGSPSILNLGVVVYGV